MGQWKSNVDKHQKALSAFQPILRHRESDMRTVQRKLDYVSDFMKYARK